MNFWRDYVLLARWDKPIGVWLLLIPCWWGLLLGLRSESISLERMELSHVFYAVYFAVGAFLMRGAGCVWNDILDRRADARVERTRERPLASGRLSVGRAIIFMVVQIFLGGIVLLQFPIAAIFVAFGSLFLVVLYPLMKRVTYWPQAWLGLTFNWGLWVGFFVVGVGFSIEVLLLYVGCVFWTLGYDTIYAMQDREDDRLIGVKSTALLFGDSVIYWVLGFYIIFHGLFGVVGWLLGGFYFWVFWVAGLVHLFWQVRMMGGGDYGRIFRSNRVYGLLMVVGLFPY